MTAAIRSTVAAMVSISETVAATDVG